VKTNTAPIGVKNGVSQQMVQINEHSQKEYQIDPPKLISIKQISDTQGYYKMHSIMDDELQTHSI